MTSENLLQVKRLCCFDKPAFSLFILCPFRLSWAHCRYLRAVFKIKINTTEIGNLVHVWTIQESVPFLQHYRLICLYTYNFLSALKIDLYFLTFLSSEISQDHLWLFNSLRHFHLIIQRFREPKKQINFQHRLCTFSPSPHPLSEFIPYLNNFLSAEYLL